jgi:hypothetical protein
MSTRLAAVCALVLLLLAPRPASAQLRRAVVGGALGTAGGVATTFSIVVARARFERAYLESPGDLVHWESIPIIAGPTAGVVFALAGEDVLEGGIRGSVAGLLIGTGTGVGLGALLSREPEWRWAGGVIGGGLGVSFGGFLGAVLSWLGITGGSSSAAPVRIPIAVTLPL